jgi:hypothetical protein
MVVVEDHQEREPSMEKVHGIDETDGVERNGYAVGRGGIA